MNNEYIKNIYYEDCISGSDKIEKGSVKLLICDPPFGINESKFDQHYKRETSNIISGYVEAPEEYDQWTLQWMQKAKELLHEDGTFYVVIGHTKLKSVLQAAEYLDFHLINHIIWKFNFGVNTKKKFVTSHYHILYYAKSSKANLTFNTYCRFGSQEKDSNNGSLLYQDMEDVFVIKKEYSPNEVKNQNKLPEELIKKLIQYSSNENDLVCDFFMGNFTTAFVALKMGRQICGFEKNQEAFNLHYSRLALVEFGSGLKELKKVENITPKNQGKSITEQEFCQICADYSSLILDGKTKKEASLILQDKYGRGRFAIKNILDKYYYKKSK
jgi:site-specific DNA-methyltransferase (adenine-specific)